MSAHAWLAAEVARYRYADGWEFTIDQAAGTTFTAGVPYLRVVYPSTSLGMSAVRTFTPIAALVDTRDPAIVAEWMITVVRDVHTTETRRTLRRDGVLVDDPDGARSWPTSQT